jgi:hypothetical protein
VTTSVLALGLEVVLLGVGLGCAARALPRDARCGVFEGVGEAAALVVGGLVAGAAVLSTVASGLRAPTRWTAPTPPPTSSAPTTAAEATALIRLPWDLR